MAIEQHVSMMTYAEWKALPEGTPGELIEGEYVVAPAPRFRHQHIVINIAHAIRNFLDEHPEFGIVAIAPVDVELKTKDPAIVLQPDVLFVSAAREGIIQDVVEGPPDLAVEVVSPGSTRRDAVRKRYLYERYGVKEFWLVWPEDERIDVISGEGFHDQRELGVGDVLTTPLLPGLELPVAKVFQKRPGR